MQSIFKIYKAKPILYAAAIIISSNCLSFAQQNDVTRIERVEKGLRPYRWALFGDEPYVDILERMEFYRVPGVSIAVIENGQLVWAKGYGVKDYETKEPVTVNTLFQAASISKSLNATVIMNLVEQGKLALDADVNTYLNSWKVPSNQFTTMKAVTVSHLLNHTGGTTNFNDRTGYLGYKTTDSIPTVQQMLRGEPPAKTPPVSVERLPGTAFGYSNGGSLILQLLLMEMKNQPYQQILKEVVLDPLGMSNSVFMQPLSDSLKILAASAHDRWVPLEGNCMVYPELAAAGLWTTPTDLSKFIIEQWLSLNGKSNKIVSKEIAERMITLTVDGSDYSEGFEITRKGDETYFGHRGGSYGFYSNMIMNKDSGNGAIVMVNGGSDGINSNLRREILISIATEYGWNSYLPPRMKPITVAPGKMQRITGRFYVSEDNAMWIKEADGEFTVQNFDRGVVDIFPISDEELVAKSIRPLRFRLIEGKDIGNDTLVITSSSEVTKACRLSGDIIMPHEYLASGRIEKAIELYKEIKEAGSSNAAVRENRINKIGYDLLGQNKFKEAVAIFTLNTDWYPHSANTYDSLGEAYMNTGDRDRAILNYKKSLELNPENTNAEAMLKRLRKRE